ncbi:MAG TPA: hypothetical protein VNL15_05435, partial [Dehalococcoidia bacterium]|nr:hypothetical protein [Dehalococcoidia bacterium]
MAAGRRGVPEWTGWPTVEEILALTGAGRSQTYQLCGRILEWLPTLVGRPGRPARPPEESALVATMRAARDYILAHPGAACCAGERARYSDGFRRFVVALAAPGGPGEGLTSAQLADAAGVPPETL